MQSSPESQVKTEDVTGTRRSVMQNAKLAIRDVYDVATELVTNADDSYQRMKSEGRIEIEVERRRGEKGSVLRVRDFAEGMTLSEMERKLKKTGGRESQLESGALVRGTNSRGAKDIAALGSVTFESIANDGCYHKCEISAQFRSTFFGSEKTNKELRRVTGIKQGTGTVVTIELDPTVKVPLHETLKKSLESLVSLRDIIGDPKRTIVLRDLGQKREAGLKPHRVEVTERLKKTIEVPDYPEATAKLTVFRAKKPFARTNQRFRAGGILIKSRHAIHESTLFDSSLEHDPHAQWFCGRLVCPHIDQLLNEYDDRFESGESIDPLNPIGIIEPGRRSGLIRSHPFVVALFREVLKLLRPLVEEERRRVENQRATVESAATRKRLNALEKAASKFMEDLGENEDSARDDATKERGSRFRQLGYMLSPPFYQLVVGQSVSCRLNIRQETFPEFEVGATVEINCLTPEISASRRFASLEPHPAQEGVLQARWSVKGVSATEATAIRVLIGAISTESTMEVFASEADKYAHVDSLRISKKTYRIKFGKRKTVRVLAPLSMVSGSSQLEVRVTGGGFRLIGERTIKPVEKYGVAMCDLVLKAGKEDGHGTLEVKLLENHAKAELAAIAPEGVGIKISIEDKDFVNQRYTWRKNVLEIAARHPALSRYLGSSADDFPGQEEKHFCTIIAEVVTDAVCAKILAENIKEQKEEFEDADWDDYYSEYTKLMSQFGPIAHKVQCPEP